MEDRALKAKLASDPANIKLTSFDTTRLDGDQQDGDLLQITTEGPGFVHDSRLDPVSAAPNTVPEVVVQMLVSSFTTALMRTSPSDRVCCFYSKTASNLVKILISPRN